MDDGVPQSVFVLVSWDINAPCCISLVQLETKKHNQYKYTSEAEQELTRKELPQLSCGQSFSSLETQLNQKEYVAHFSQPQWSSMNWVFAAPINSTSTEQNLYMFPKKFRNDDDATLRGCEFDLRTKACQSMRPTAMEYRHVVTLGGYIYVIAQPNYHGSRDITFKRYDPALDWWEALESFPGHAALKLGSKADRIVATAVLNDAILFNMGGSEIWAYDVERDKWCPVKVDGDLWCCSIVGEAVVIGNTIYALTTRSDQLVLALSIRREDVNGDDGFVCSLDCKILVDIYPILFPYATARSSRHLIHLGKDNFCLVQSCHLVKSSSPVYQPIQLINIKLNEEHSGKSMTVIDECIHLLRIPDCEQFSVEFCFSMPECKTTAIREGKNFCFNLNPYPVGFDPKQKINTHFDRKPEEEFETLIEDDYGHLVNWKPEEEFETLIEDDYGPLVNDVATSELLAKSIAASQKTSETIYTDAEGHSISVRNLLPDASFGQFDKEFKKGASKRLEIQFIVDHDYDTVSAIITEGFSSRDVEKRRSGLTDTVDGSRTSKNAMKKLAKKQMKKPIV